MKEKIIKILESQFSVVEYEDPDTGFTESTTIDVLTTDEFPDIVDKLEILVNQEVEKRIAERMPSEMTLEEAEIAAKETDYACFAVEPEGNEINFADAAAFYLEGWNACRSRLTNPGVKDSQKTEGGTK
jgi:hypothetical protein